MRNAVVSAPLQPEAKRIAGIAVRRIRDRLAHVAEQFRLRHREAPRISRPLDRSVKFEVRQPGNIVKVQRIARVARPSDVCMRPRRGQFQVMHGITMRQAAGFIAMPQREVELCGAQFHVVAPLALRIKNQNGATVSSCPGAVSAKSKTCSAARRHCFASVWDSTPETPAHIPQKLARPAAPQGSD